MPLSTSSTPQFILLLIMTILTSDVNPKRSAHKARRMLRNAYEVVALTRSPKLHSRQSLSGGHLCT
jgi:hypothetical protein